MEAMIKRLKEEIFFLRQQLDAIAQGSLDPSELRLDGVGDGADGSDPMVEIQDLEGEQDGQPGKTSTLNGAEGPSSG